MGLVMAMVCVATFDVRAQAPLGTGFNYQGRIKVNGVLEDGPCDCIFRLFDASTGGFQIGPTLTFDGVGMNPPPVAVVGGLFQAQVDFGPNAFDGDERWLQLSVRCPAGAGNYITVAPRQLIQPAPYAIYAIDGLAVSSLSGPGGNPQHAVVVNSSGNVGIGVVSPTSRLEVDGDVLTTRDFFISRSTVGTNAAATSLGYSGVTGGVLTLSNSGQNDIRAGQDNAGGYLRFMVDNSAPPSSSSDGIEALTLRANGNVGISMPSPGARVHAIVDANWNSAAYSFLFENRETQNSFGNTFRVMGGGGAGDGHPSSAILTAGDLNGNVDFVVRGDGNVGIGTSSPSTRLQLRADGNEFNLINATASGDVPSIHFRNFMSGEDWYINPEGSDLIFQTELASGEVLTLADTGRVGIGTTTPAAPLDVMATNGLPALIVSNNDSQILLEDPTATNTVGLVLSDAVVAGGGFAIQRRNASGAFLDNHLLIENNTGRIGIGALPTSPHRVTVGGSVCATGFPICSDRRLKEGFTAVTGALEQLQLLQPWRFTWRRTANPALNLPDGIDVGFVAQEVQAALPEAVGGSEDTFFSVDYARIVPVVVAGVQELHAATSRAECERDADRRRIEEQQQTIDALQTEIAEVRAALQANEALLQRLLERVGPIQAVAHDANGESK